MSAKNKQLGLGKGFDVLMPAGVDQNLINRGDDRVQNLFIKDIEPNPDQPRRTFDEKQLNELAESIKQHGVLQPLLVVKKGNKFQIIAGERRWRASKIAKLEKIPAVTKTVKEVEKLEIAMVENIQRVDLSPLEQAESIKRLHETFSLSFDEVAAKLNKASSTVNNIVRLLQLPPSAQAALRDGGISEGHARTILSLKDQPEMQEKLLILIQKNHWSVRQAEQFVVAAKSGAKSSDKAKKRTDSTTSETKQLSKILSRPVTINHMAKGGRLVIRFETDDDLGKLIELLASVKAKN